MRALEGHVETLKADIVTLTAQLAKQVAEFSVDLAAERTRSEKAIAALAALADRLMTLAADQRKPWWCRLVG